MFYSVLIVIYSKYDQDIQMHKMFIMFIRIGIRKTRNTDDSLGTGTKLLLPSLSLGFRHEERETQFFYADCSSIVSFQLTNPTNARAHPAIHGLDCLAQVRKINLLRLSSNPNFHRFLAWRHSYPQSFHIFGVFIATSVIVSSSTHALEHLR